MQPIPFIAFFLSGASSLIFQMIWTRLLQHVFGSSSVAISSVVSVFMGGLALGAWLFGRFADRVRSPLRLYALAEVGVGVCGLLVPLLVRPEGWLADTNALLRSQLGAESGLFMVARFLCIVPILIVPTTLMGSTLPLLARHFVSASQRPEQASTRVGSLYAVNTAGAVAGVFLGGFVLMPNLGVSTANTVAAGMNFSLAALILTLGRYLRPLEGPGVDNVAAAADAGPCLDTGPLPHRIRVTAAVAFAASGFAALLYEVVWSRALINAIGASVYSFALILITFLVGIAGGSAVATAVISGRRALTGSAIAALVLTALGATPVLVSDGLDGLGLALGLCLAAWAGLWVERRHRARQAALFGVEAAGDLRLAALSLLAVPLLLSLGCALLYQNRLSFVCGSMVGSIALFMAVLLLTVRRRVLCLAALQLQIGLAALISDVWADELSLTFASMVAPLYDVLPDSVDLVMAMMFVTVWLCVLPAALGMGAMFPLTMRVWSAGGARIGREVGVVYTGNTVGSIVGAWLPGFLLMPRFGMQGTLHLGIGLNLLLALVLLVAWSRTPGWAQAPSALRRLVKVGAVLLPAAVALLYLSSTRPGPLTWNLSKMTLGAFRISLARDVIDEEAWGEPDLVYYRDGLATTVTVERWGRHYSLKNNGKVEASNGDDMPTQIMVSALPLLLHERGAQDLDVAIVGFGSGVTVGAALQFPVRAVEVMELEKGVVEASRFFREVNHLTYAGTEFPYVDTERLTVINDDGRNYLAATDKDFDVIISEPSNPWLTGVSDLFTVDHFRLSKKRLRPGGIYCQWVQLYELSPENVKVIYRTFASQFAHVLVFSAEDLSSDTVLLGSDSPLRLDIRRVERAFQDPRVVAELGRAYIHTPTDVFARALFASRDEVMEYARYESRLQDGRWVQTMGAHGREDCPPQTCRREPAPLNTDDNAYIEFRAPRDLIGFERYKGYLRTMYAASWPYGELSQAVKGFGSGAVASERLARQALSLLAHGRKAEAVMFLREAEAEAEAEGKGPELERVRAIAAGLGDAPAEPVLVGTDPFVGDELSLSMANRLRHGHAAVLDWIGRGEPVRALGEMGRIPGPLRRYGGSGMLLLEGYLLTHAGRHGDAVEVLEALARGEPEFLAAHPELYFYLARAHDGLLHFDKAVRNMGAYVERAARVTGPPAAVAADRRPAPSP